LVTSTLQGRHVLSILRIAFERVGNPVSFDEVLPSDVIPLTAAIAAQEHGDARKATEIIRHAGELAERENIETVTEERPRRAGVGAKRPI
jgi:Cdc6-like AAA superfamily ATPase